MTNATAGANLIRRYLRAVEQELPARLRSDVAREIGSLLEDKLEERTGGQTPTEGAVFDVLKELGDPRVVARRVDPHPRYLVGPELFPMFARITKIILAGAAGIALLATYVPRLVQGNPLDALLSLGALGHAVALYYQVVRALFAQLVVTFFVLERYRVRVPDLTEPFDPRDLPELPETQSDEMTFADFAGRVGGLTVAAVFVNLAPGFVIALGAGHANALSLADFGIVLPVTLINAWILLGLGFAFITRSVGRWTLWLRALDLAIGLFGVWVAYALVDGSSVHAPATIPHLAPLAHVLGRILPYLPVFALLGVGLDLWKVVLRYVRKAEGSTEAV